MLWNSIGAVKTERAISSPTECARLRAQQCLHRSAPGICVVAFHSRTPGDHSRRTIALAVATNGAQCKFRTAGSELRINPTNRLLVREIIADGRKVHQMDSLVAADRVFVRVAIKD